MSDSSGGGSESGVVGPGEVGTRFSEWRCTECGHGHPKNNPPCDRCGSMRFELVETDPEEFAPGAGITYLDVLRENALLAGVALFVLGGAGLALLANSGVLVLSDPFGLGYRYGAVDAVQPDDDGTLTAGELRALVEREYAVESLAWNGRTLRLQYRSEAGSNAGLADELGEVAVTYAEYVGQGGDAERLRVTAVREDGRGVRVTVERSLAQRFADGDLSRSQYVDRALSGE
jgi:hypothetical protein